MGGHVPHGAHWHVGEVGEEGVQEPDGSELEAEAQPVVVAAALLDHPEVHLGEVEESGGLLGRGLAAVSTVGAALLVCEGPYWQEVGLREARFSLPGRE